MRDKLKTMRKRIYSIVEFDHDDDKIGQYYDAFMLLIIIISLVPLAFKSTNDVFLVIDYITTGIFIIDYIMRWITADFKLENESPVSFVIYPITPMAFIDLVVILTALPTIDKGFKILKVIRLIKTIKVVKVFKAFKIARYSKSLFILIDVIKQESKTLGAVATLAVAYILVSALVIFNVEPDSFNDYFEAVYWATVSLTTVGYGDLYPTSFAGRIVTMFSSLFGTALVALPASILTGGYLKRLNIDKE